MRKNVAKVWWWVGGVAVVILVLGWRGLMTQSRVMNLASSQKYEAIVPDWKIVDVAKDLGQVTRVKITPDNRLVLVATLTGEIWALTPTRDGWARQDEVFYHIPGIVNSSGENGMTGLIVSSDYANNQFVFATYTKSLGGNRGENQIMRLTVTKQDGRYVGTEPEVIFTGNTPVSGAHQIQGGTGVMIEGRPHLLFPIGEGYQEHHARDLKREAGKIMLIQEDGSAPLGVRPYPEYPKIQAIGIRNVYDIALDPDQSDWVFFTQNGPDRNDNIIHAPILDGHQYDFNWRSENNPATLLKPLRDGIEQPEYIIRNWEITVSPNDIVVDNDGKIYVTILSSSRYPNKEIVEGQMTDGGWSWQILTKRQSNQDGGNPLGLALARNGVLYVGDIYDGAVYALFR